MSNLVEHARRELEQAGLFGKDSDYEGMLGVAVLSLVKIFAKQGHSGFSAAMAVSLFEKLARFEPLTPLTGEEDEWNEVGPGVWQNRRCSHVFKERGGDRPLCYYDSQGKIFRDKEGQTYTSRDSRVAITFPYWPKSEIVDALE